MNLMSIPSSDDKNSSFVAEHGTLHLTSLHACSQTVFRRVIVGSPIELTVNTTQQLCHVLGNFEAPKSLMTDVQVDVPQGHWSILEHVYVYDRVHLCVYCVCVSVCVMGSASRL